MKTSSTGRPPDRATAAGFLTTNLCVLPGLGTFMAGEKWRGLAQMFLALGGLTITLLWFFPCVLHIMKTRSLLLPINGLFFTGLGGFFLFIIAWLWSLGSGRRFLCEAGHKDGAN